MSSSINFSGVSPEAQEKIVSRLSDVLDPELGLDIVTLGFVRKIEVDRPKSIKVTMTLTTPMCPMQDEISAQVRASLKGTGYSEVIVEYDFGTPWTPPSEVKAILGL